MSQAKLFALKNSRAPTAFRLRVLLNEVLDVVWYLVRYIAPFLYEKIAERIVNILGANELPTIAEYHCRPAYDRLRLEFRDAYFYRNAPEYLNNRVLS
jgi:hypothetical protein